MLLSNVREHALSTGITKDYVQSTANAFKSIFQNGNAFPFVPSNRSTVLQEHNSHPGSPQVLSGTDDLEDELFDGPFRRELEEFLRHAHGDTLNITRESSLFLETNLPVSDSKFAAPSSWSRDDDDFHRINNELSIQKLKQLKFEEPILSKWSLNLYNCKELANMIDQKTNVWEGLNREFPHQPPVDSGLLSGPWDELFGSCNVTDRINQIEQEKIQISRQAVQLLYDTDYENHDGKQESEFTFRSRNVSLTKHGVRALARFNLNKISKAVETLTNTEMIGLFIPPATKSHSASVIRKTNPITESIHSIRFLR